MRTINEGQELELITVLQSIVNGFGDDPAHDAAALLKRITGEVPWTGDSFQLPSRQECERLHKNSVATTAEASRSAAHRSCNDQTKGGLDSNPGH